MTTPISHILYPTDFSDNARQALPFALHIAKKTNAELHILHAIEEPYDFAPMAQKIKQSVHRKVELLFQEIIEEIRADEAYRELPISTGISLGRAAYAIQEEVEQKPGYLIIMGTRGRSTIERLLVGSTTSETIGHTHVPVVAIPEAARFGERFSHFLFATDYREHDLEALAYVNELAKLLSADITVFHASSNQNLVSEINFRGFREVVRETIDAPNIIFEQVNTDDFISAIEAKITTDRPAIVAMVRYQQPFSLLGPHHSRKMSQLTSKPLLVIPGDPEFFNAETNDKSTNIKKGKQPIKRS